MQLIGKLTKQILKEVEEEELLTVCEANFCSPVIDKARFIDEISYTIGNRRYTENAPHV